MPYMPYFGVLSQATGSGTPTWVFMSEGSSPWFTHIVQHYVNWAGRVAAAKQYLDNNYPAAGFPEEYGISVQIEPESYIDFRVMYL